VKHAISAKHVKNYEAKMVSACKINKLFLQARIAFIFISSKILASIWNFLEHSIVNSRKS